MDTIVPIGEWLPDQPDFDNAGSATIQNVYPRTKSSYGPMPTPAVYSGALTARCQGSYAFVDKTASPHIYAGDATKLYQLTPGSAPNFSDVSRLVGGAYATGSPIDPAAPTISFWSMDSFGERIVATNYADAPQTFLVGTDTNFSALSANAPNARFVATIRDFVVLGYTSDATYGVQPRRAWWSAVGNPLSWPVPGTAAAIQVQSDYQDFQQSDLGQMTGLIGGHLASADGAAFFERGIYRMKYVGASGGIFDIQVAEGAAGTQSPLSIVRRRAMGNTAVAFYYSEDGFQAFDGMSAVAIGVNKFDRAFYNDLDPAYLSAIQGVADPSLPLVYFFYNSAGGSGAGLYDRMLVYNTVLGRGALCDLTATPVEWAARAMTLGKTLDALDAIYGTLDAVPAPLDSGIFVGNRPRVALFDSAHKMNFLTGSNMAATCDTGEAQPTAGRRSKILSARPLVDGGSPSVAIATRDRLIDSVTYQAAVPVNVIGECPQRMTGRYVRARVTIPAASTWNHLQGVELDLRAEGRR
jgi:hypothetical protein